MYRFYILFYPRVEDIIMKTKKKMNDMENENKRLGKKLFIYFFRDYYFRAYTDFFFQHKKTGLYKYQNKPGKNISESDVFSWIFLREIISKKSYSLKTNWGPYGPKG